MKKFFALALSVIMLLPLVSCALRPADSFGEVVSPDAIAADELIKTGAVNMG